MREKGIENISEVGLYGLTYKENVDDLRESPTLQMLERFEKYFVKGINVFDPMVKENKVAGQTQDFDEFLEKSKFIVVLVGHQHLKDNLNLFKNKIILDTRNIFEACDKVYKL